MNVVVDVGNTRVKYAFFEQDHLVVYGYGWDELEKEMKKLREKEAKLALLLAGSGHIPEEQILFLKGLADEFVEAASTMPLPLKIDYKTPETLGFDRIANCVGAMKLFPKTPLLVIDSGTCITYNQLSDSGIFLGGNISPGVEMRFKSLHHYTSKLPCLSPAKWEPCMGKTTDEAIRNGVMLGVLAEMKSYIIQMRAQESSLKVVLTGGNAHWLQEELGEELHLNEQLGLLGLNEVLNYVKKAG